MTKFERRKTIFKGIFDEEEQKLPDITSKVTPVDLRTLQLPGIGSAKNILDDKGKITFSANQPE